MINPEIIIKRYAPNHLELIEQFNSLIKDESQEMQWDAFSMLIEQILPSYEFDVISIDSRGKEINRKRGKAHYFTVELGEGVSLDMVYVPGGEAVIGIEEKKDKVDSMELLKQEKCAGPIDKFWMSPPQKVKIKSFFISKYLITNLQWKTIAKEPIINYEMPWKIHPSYHHQQGDNFPATFKGVWQGIEFCERLSKKVAISYRLPNDAEWEYACRSGTKTSYYFGEVMTPQLANYRTWEIFDPTITKRTTPVGIFPSNSFGLYDMHGNLLELCLGHKLNTVDNQVISISFNHEDIQNYFQYACGGCWSTDLSYCHSSHRFTTVSDLTGRLGLRVVCGIKTLIT